MAVFIPHDVEREDRPDGTILLRSRIPLGPVAKNTGAWLHEWAQKAPERVFLAERFGESWHEVTYAQALTQVRAIAASLLKRNLNADTPIVVISGNSIHHALLSLAGQYVGVPIVPLAEQYSLVHEAHPRLEYAIKTVNPGLVFADDAMAYGPALALPCMEGIEKVCSHPEHSPVPVTSFDSLLTGQPDSALDAAHEAVGHETVAKIMFTSGSTSNPKGVLTTHGMLCVNQAQIVACNPILREKPPKILDWLPWNHVFGGSFTFNMMLSNGGSIYIDDGKPTPKLIGNTIRNIKEHQGNMAFNVPVGYGQLAAAMRDDPQLKHAYFKNTDFMFYAGASVPKPVWDELKKFAIEVRGEVPMMVSGLGMTETSPHITQIHQPTDTLGLIGVPVPGVTLKLIPDNDMRCEFRVKGPNVLKGYYKEPDKTKEAFDDEGFLVTGDAVKFLDRSNPSAGLVFDGRVSDDFKLVTGTWVRATTLRLEAMRHFSRIALDVVLTGHDRNELGLLVFPDPESFKAAGLQGIDKGGALVSQIINKFVGGMLKEMAQSANSSSTRIMRAMVMAAPPSMSEGELTAKGTLNNRKVLTLRKEMVERLYKNPIEDEAIIHLDKL